MQRKTAVVGFLVLAALAVATANVTWMTSSQTSVTGAEILVNTTGHQAAPAITAAALVAVAAALFLTLSGRIAQWVALAVLTLSGIIVVGSAVGVTIAPQAAVSSAIAEATGIVTTNPQYAATPWGYVTALIGVVMIALAVGCVVSVRRWAVATSKYDLPVADRLPVDQTPQDAGTGPDRVDRKSQSVPLGEVDPSGILDERDAWDALSGGIDPTDGSAPGSEPTS